MKDRIHADVGLVWAGTIRNLVISYVIAFATLKLLDNLQIENYLGQIGWAIVFSLIGLVIPTWIWAQTAAWFKKNAWFEVDDQKFSGSSPKYANILDVFWGPVPDFGELDYFLTEISMVVFVVEPYFRDGTMRQPKIVIIFNDRSVRYIDARGFTASACIRVATALYERGVELSGVKFEDP